MIVFGLMTISNVRQVQSRLHPTSLSMNTHVSQDPAAISVGRQNQRKKTDRQLLNMLFVQIVVILLLTLPIGLLKLYTTITSNTPKSALKNTTENFLFNLFLLLTNLAAGMPFYLHSLSGGSVFQKAVFSLMKTLARRMRCRGG
jgi:hypothetical protein